MSNINSTTNKLFFPANSVLELTNNENYHKPLQAMDTLKPPIYVNSTQQNKELLTTVGTPSHSKSIDLSTLKLELWSISSADNSDLGSDTNYDFTDAIIKSFQNTTNIAEENVVTLRTVRSKSHDSSQSPENFLRRHSRIEHLSELFR